MSRDGFIIDDILRVHLWMPDIRVIGRKPRPKKGRSHGRWWSTVFSNDLAGIITDDDPHPHTAVFVRSTEQVIDAYLLEAVQPEAVMLVDR